jgi:hypothetical protein
MSTVTLGIYLGGLDLLNKPIRETADFPVVFDNIFVLLFTVGHEMDLFLAFYKNVFKNKIFKVP